MLKIFITAKILSDFVSKEAEKLDHERSSLYRILNNKKYSKIFIGSLDIQSANKIANFKQMYDISVDISKISYVDSIPSSPSLVMEEPNALFILNVSKDVASNISRTYGVLCFSSDGIEDRKLIDKNIEYSPYKKDNVGGWAPILSSIKDLPSNALVIIDRYLFSNDTKTFTNGIRNVYDVLKTLLPEQLDVNTHYHVMIVFSLSPNKKALSFEELSTLINKEKKTLGRSYPIDIELISISNNSRFYDDTHNRRIISNYYIVRAEHQIGAFFDRLSSCSQTLTPQRLFTFYCLRSYSDPPLKSIEQTVSTLKSLSDILTSEIKQKLCSYAFNGKVITPEKCNKEQRFHILNRRVLC